MLLSSNNLAEWLTTNRIALALTALQSGGLFLLSGQPGGSVRANQRKIDRCQGLWTDGRECWIGSRSILWRFSAERSEGSADRLFVPREGRVTGDLDVHDVAVGDLGDGTRGPIFVATSHNCLATTSAVASFRPLWRPPFVSALVAEDRCHLNGLAMDGDRPAFVTAFSRSDVADGWRDRRHDGGIVVDVASGEVVAHGLSMPHSPRWHGGRLWVLESGRGEFGAIDLASGRFEPVAFCPGYARGLAFHAGHAIVGLSRPRGNHTFEGLELDARLAAKDAVPRCGFVVIDLATGRTVAWMRFEREVDELYDVAVLPGVATAEAIGFQGRDIERTISIEAG